MITGDQADAVRALDWLLDPSQQTRQTGRSFAISIALVRQALRYPGRWVYYLDHAQVSVTGQRDLNRLQAQYVQMLTEIDHAIRVLPWEIGRERFRVLAVDHPPAADRWWPTEAAMNSGGELLRAGMAAERRRASLDPPPAKTVWERLLNGFKL